MTIADRWLLPDGIEEILPAQALLIEQKRRQLLDLYQCWGYDLVIPPLVEFTESLLSGASRDLDLMTFKLTDQQSGRLMGIRADITTQTARMDAHSLQLQGPCRLCYAGTALVTRQRTPLESRAPIQVGAELFGEAGVAADIEIIELMLASLGALGIDHCTLELGHVDICRGLISDTELNAEQESELFDLLQRKAAAELAQWVDTSIADPTLAAAIRKLPALAGGREVLAAAAELFAPLSARAAAAVEQLQFVVGQLLAANPQLDIHIDLSELLGYHYHNGIVFAAYLPQVGKAVAKGGRYDEIGVAFGRARPATGFGLDLKALVTRSTAEREANGIFASYSSQPGWRAAIAELRACGERVIAGFPGQQPDFSELHCNRLLVEVKGQFAIQPIA